MKSLTFSQENFEKGLYALDDDSKAPLGSARKMLNVIITDRKGIAPRPGSLLLGDYNSSSYATRGIYNFKKGDGTEILLKPYSTKLEFYYNSTWNLLKDGFTADKDFGFVTSLVNTDEEDFVYFCNQYEEYQRWRGAVTLLNGALSGSETTITVDSVLKSATFESATATANTTTTITVLNKTWKQDMWAGFYIHIPSTGVIRRIVSNTSDTLTVRDFSSAPGNVAFEIRKLAFPFARLVDTTIAFVDGGGSNDSITDTGNRFLHVGFKAGDRIVISGSTNNSKTFTIKTVVAGTITLEDGESVTAEVAGSSITITLESMRLIYNGTVISYTNIDTATTFTVASAHAGSDNAVVTCVPEIVPSGPRGNRIETLQGRVFVGNSRFGIIRDASGNIRGSGDVPVAYVSKLSNPKDFSFAATRVAGEGDVLSVPYGGGQITDIKAQEDVVYIYKENYIEAVKYSGDSDDVAVRTPLKPGTGSVGRVIKGKDDQYFMTVDKEYSSIGRVASKDVTPQTQNLGLVIKRLLSTYNHDSFNGIEFNNRIISFHKSSSTASKNDVMLVYNRQTKSFEGIWSLGANSGEIYADKAYFGESNGANVWQLFYDTSKSDVRGSTTLPVTAEWKSSFFNVLPLKSNIQAINSVHIEGYIRGGTEFTTSIYADFSETPILQFTFSGTEDEFLLGDDPSRFLASYPLATQPIVTIGDIEDDGRRRFSFQVYFPFKYGQYFSVGFKSDGKNQDWEVIRAVLGLKESISTRVSATKSL